MTRNVALPLLIQLAVLSFGAEAAAEKPGMPEPILTESVTDIDARGAGELEVSASGLTLGLARGARVVEASVEAEWRVIDRLGLRLEPTYVYERRAQGAPTKAFVLQAGAAWGLWHDWRRDFHVQVELTGRAGGEALDAQPGDPTLPVALDLRAGGRREALTVRASLGMEAFGPAGDRVGARAGAAALFGLGRGARLGFAGVELEADSARPHPFALAPDLVADMAPAGLPLRLETALPWVVGASPSEPRLGLLLRLICEVDLDEAEERAARRLPPEGP